MSAAGFPLASLLAASPSLAVALRGLQRAAASEAPVLLLGEPGSGRSSLARAVHGASGRDAGPLVELDPATVPGSLFESELFGHRAGAFTGADRDRPGRLAAACGGSLLLDRVEEIPLAVQPKLLRLLAERRYAPLGGGAERAADVRFLAVGPDDLPARAERGVFRRDLFHRLDVLAFRVPPLRERPRDLPGILEFLLADLAERAGCGRCELSARALAWMAAHPWPGNLRQVRSVLEREMLLTGGPILDPAPLPEVGGEPPPLAAVEAAHLRAVLAYTRGHQGRAAQVLGISRKALWEKRRRFGIP